MARSSARDREDGSIYPAWHPMCGHCPTSSGFFAYGSALKRQSVTPGAAGILSILATTEDGPIDTALREAVDEGRITEEQAGEVRYWWQQRPKILTPDVFPRQMREKWRDTVWIKSNALVNLDGIEDRGDARSQNTKDLPW